MKILFFLSLFFGATAFSSKQISLGEEELSIPIRIQPAFVEATRWVDLRNFKNEVQLFEYPILEYNNISQVELSYNNNFKVKIGKMQEALASQLDMHTAVYQPKKTSYKILRRLGFDTGDVWRYANEKSKIETINNGKIIGSFDPGGYVAIQKYIEPRPLTQAPWIYYEYEIPMQGAWFTVISGKIKKQGLLGQRVAFTSGPIWGAGKKSITLDLLKLLREVDPYAKDGKLEELNLQYFLAENGQLPQRDVSIDLGKLSFIKGLNENTLYIPLDNNSGEINLYKTIENYLTDNSKLSLQSVKIKNDALNFKLRLKSDFVEKTPELFVGDAFLVNQLTPEELTAVLEQKIFFEKTTLWERTSSQIVTRKSGVEKELVANFDVNINMNNVANNKDKKYFLICDFLNELGRDEFLNLNISGIDPNGKNISQQYTISRNHEVSLSDFQKVTRLSFAFAENAVSVLLRKVQINEYKKINTFKPVQQTAMIGLAPMQKSLFEAGFERLKFRLELNDDLQTIKNFGVGSSVSADYLIQYELMENAGTKLDYFLRVRSLKSEKIYPIQKTGELKISNIRLQGVDLLAKLKKELAVEGLQIDIKKFEVRRIDTVTQKFADQSWLSSFYSEQLGKPKMKLQEMIDSTLTKGEILSGGKVVNLPLTKFQASDYILLGPAVFDYSFMKKRADEAQARALELLLQNKESKKGKIFKLLIGLIFIFLLFKYSGKWMPWVDRGLSQNYIFWAAQALLWALASIKIIHGGPRGASEGGLILVLIYSISVKYKLRKILGKVWTQFSSRNSSAYFIGFLALLPICLLMLVSKQQFAAEFWAMIGFYLLLLGLIIEFIAFAQNAEKDF